MVAIVLGAQLAVDTTLVSALQCGRAAGGAATRGWLYPWQSGRRVRSRLVLAVEAGVKGGSCVGVGALSVVCGAAHQRPQTVA